MLISTQQEFEEFVTYAANQDVLAIDTEFLREKTYYARLCLLQFAAGDRVALVDPFSVKDLSGVARLFRKTHITKVFHAGMQDIEILLHETGAVPWPVFDTQIAATLLGYNQQVGYAALVYGECGVQLPKLESMTDWSLRPMTQAQLEYAADDVIYLPQIYEQMVARLNEQGRTEWLQSDFKALVDPKRYNVDPRERFRHLKRASHLSRRQLSAAREVAAWREKEARKRDVPRKWVITDEQIVESCKRQACSIEDLFVIRGMKEHFSTKDAREITKLISLGLNRPQSEWPVLDGHSKNERNVDVEVSLMEALVKQRSRETGIAPQTLASRDDVMRLARGYEDCALLKGWRLDIIGRDLLRVLHGEVSLRLKDDQIEIQKG